MHVWQSLVLSFFQQKNLHRQILIDDQDIFTWQTPQGKLLQYPERIESSCGCCLVFPWLSSLVFPKTCPKLRHIHKSNSTGQLVDSSSSHWELLWLFPRPTRTKTDSEEAPRLARISTERDFLRRRWLWRWRGEGGKSLRVGVFWQWINNWIYGTIQLPCTYLRGLSYLMMDIEASVRTW